MTSMLQMLLLVSALQTPDGAGPAIQPNPPTTTQPETAPIPDTAQTPPPTAAHATSETSTTSAQPVAQPRKKGPDLGGLLVSAMGGLMLAGGLVFGAIAAGISVIPEFPGGSVEQQGAMNAAIVGSVFFGLAGAVLVAVGLVLVGTSML